jgi:very-short-patch-repair endonuclease
MSSEDRGRRLRAELAYEERKFGAHLRTKRCGGLNSPQHPIGPYFADFCCVAQRLIIELNGSQHAEPQEERKDGLRTAYLNEQGYRVMRFWNEHVNREPEGVLAKPSMP